MNNEEMYWWDDPKNKEMVSFPIAVVHDGEWWVASTNGETHKLLGEELTGCAQGKTKEEAINHMFMMIKFRYEYSDECRLNYQRWVPFRHGPWGKIGGHWFAIFGIHLYFRYGKNMKGGCYIPLTKLNISFSSDWSIYRIWLKEKKKNEKV